MPTDREKRSFKRLPIGRSHALLRCGSACRYALRLPLDPISRNRVAQTVVKRQREPDRIFRESRADFLG